MSRKPTPPRAPPSVLVDEDMHVLGLRRDTTPSPSRRVLIVDDNRDAAASLATLLRMDGHEVDIVPDGASALDAARRVRAQVVLLDIGLPDMNGYEVARALREDADTRNALIVAITGYGRAQDREKSHGAGIDVHLTKPVDVDQLAELVARGREAEGGRR